MTVKQGQRHSTIQHEMHMNCACKLVKVCIKYKLNLQTYSILLHAIWFFWISSLVLYILSRFVSLFLFFVFEKKNHFESDCVHIFCTDFISLL